MTDEKKQAQEPPEAPTKWRQWWKNRLLRRPFFQRVSTYIERKTGVPLRYGKYRGQNVLQIEPVREEIMQKSIEGTDTISLVKLMNERAHEVAVIEGSWTDFQSYDPKTGYKGKVEQLEDIYQKSGFYNYQIAHWEYPLYERGISKTDLNIKEHVDEEEKPQDFSQLKDTNFVYDNLTIQIGQNIYTYPVPAITRIRYPIAGMNREWIVDISPFGYRRMEKYQDAYTNIINKICDDIQSSALARERDPAKRENIENWVKAIRTTYTGMIGHILTDYCMGTNPQSKFGAPIGVENKARNFVRSRGVVKRELAKFVDAMLKDSRNRFNERNIFYFNTYRIIQPVVFGNRYYSTEIVDELKKHNGHRNPGGGQWYKKDDEVDHGLDRYGYPLEVDEDGYVMIDKKNDDGKEIPKRNLLDIIQWRQIPGGKDSKFVTYADALEMANYITNLHDAYRDDLRDGRYHTGSSTIMDYVETHSRSFVVPPLWEMGDENQIRCRKDPFTDEITGQKYVPVDFTRPVMGINRALYKVGSTDKNPAFDLRYLQSKVFMHIGRRYYYQVPDHSFALMDQRKEPHISSRGVSMYIIEKVTRDVRPLSDVMGELNAIAKESKDGFDYGVRPWDMWGVNFQRNVFEWKSMLKRINALIKPKHTKEEYIKMWGTESPFWK